MAPKSNVPIPCYVETVPGIAEVGWLEIRRRFPQATFEEFLFAKDENGIVLFHFPGALEDLFRLRTAEEIFLTATYVEKISRGYRDLNELGERILRTGDFGRAVNRFTRFRHRQVSTYQLAVRKYGQHEYSHQQFAQTIRNSIDSLYPEWRRVQKGADLEVSANLFGSHILIGLRLPPGPRAQRQKALPVGMDPALAAALVQLTHPDPGDRFLDPLADEGPLLLERVQAGGARLILGGDTPFTAVRRAQQVVEEKAAVCRWQPDALPLAPNSVDKIASHFPIAPEDAYGRWLAEVGRVLQSTAQAVILTERYEQFKNAIRTVPNLEIRGGYSVKIGEQWGRIYTLAKK